MEKPWESLAKWLTGKHNYVEVFEWCKLGKKGEEQMDVLSEMAILHIRTDKQKKR